VTASPLFFEIEASSSPSSLSSSSIIVLVHHHHEHIKCKDNINCNEEKYYRRISIASKTFAELIHSDCMQHFFVSASLLYLPVGYHRLLYVMGSSSPTEKAKIVFSDACNITYVCVLVKLLFLTCHFENIRRCVRVLVIFEMNMKHESFRNAFSERKRLEKGTFETLFRRTRRFNSETEFRKRRFNLEKASHNHPYSTTKSTSQPVVDNPIPYYLLLPLSTVVTVATTHPKQYCILF